VRMNWFQKREEPESEQAYLAEQLDRQTAELKRRIDFADALDAIANALTVEDITVSEARELCIKAMAKSLEEPQP